MKKNNITELDLLDLTIYEYGFHTGYDPINYLNPIDDLINFLLEGKKQGANYVKFYGSADNGEIFRAYLENVIIKEETDEEYNTRIKEEQDKINKELEESKRRQYEYYLKLKSKFEEQ